MNKMNRLLTKIWIVTILAGVFNGSIAFAQTAEDALTKKNVSTQELSHGVTIIRYCLQDEETKIGLRKILDQNLASIKWGELDSFCDKSGYPSSLNISFFKIRGHFHVLIGAQFYFHEDLVIEKGTHFFDPTYVLETLGCLDMDDNSPILLRSPWLRKMETHDLIMFARFGSFEIKHRYVPQFYSDIQSLFPEQWIVGKKSVFLSLIVRSL